MCRQLSFDCAIELRRILGREQSVSVFHVVVGVLVPYCLYGHNGTFVVSVYTWQQTKSFLFYTLAFISTDVFLNRQKFMEIPAAEYIAKQEKSLTKTR